MPELGFEPSLPGLKANQEGVGAQSYIKGFKSVSLGRRGDGAQDLSVAQGWGWEHRAILTHVIPQLARRCAYLLLPDGPLQPHW